MQCSKSCIPKTCWSLAAGLLTAFELESGSWGSPRKQRNRIHRNRKTMTRQFKTKPSHLPNHLPAQSSHRHFSFTLCGPAQRQLQRQAKKPAQPCLSACQGRRLTRSLALPSSRQRWKPCLRSQARCSHRGMPGPAATRGVGSSDRRQQAQKPPKLLCPLELTPPS